MNVGRLCYYSLSPLYGFPVGRSVCVLSLEDQGEAHTRRNFQARGCIL